MGEALSKEPARREQISSELNAAQTQYDGRTMHLVAEAVEAVEARHKVVCKGLLALASIQHIFYHGAAESISNMLDGVRSSCASADFRGTSIVEMIDQSVGDCKAVREQIVQVLS